MNAPGMDSTVAALLATGKGILAADESLPTIAKRFAALQIPSTEEERLAYRDLLFATPGLGEYISGVILFDETIRERNLGGVPMPEALRQQGIIPGIKVDHGTVALSNFPGEKFTQGLGNLRDRLAEYRALGARFTKWRAVLAVGEKTPSVPCIRANATALAQFAALSQEAGLVPVVEPEVLMDGAHTLARSEAATRATLEGVFAALSEQRVVLEQLLLKTSMVVAGADCPEQPEPAEVAAATLRCLRRAVPSAVPGIVFLSGGQGDETATQRLAAICTERDPAWKLSFSFGRALQAPALKIWRGLAANIPAAQKALQHRARCNSLALQGRYAATAEGTAT